MNKFTVNKDTNTNENKGKLISDPQRTIPYHIPGAEKKNRMKIQILISNFFSYFILLSSVTRNCKSSSMKTVSVIYQFEKNVAI